MPLLRPLVAMLLGCALLAAAPAQAENAENGRVWRADGVLHAGCHPYRFRYRVRPGHPSWQLELFLRGPGGTGLGTVVRDSDVDRKRGRSHFTVCRNTTRPGRFRIRGKLSVYQPEGTPPFTSEPDEPDVRWIKPARFRLRRAR